MIPRTAPPRASSRTIPPHLRPAAEPGPLDAVLIEAEDAGAVLRVLAILDEGTPVSLYRVAGGVLATVGPDLLPARRDALATRGVRLRALSTRFYVPIGADVVPALLDDEAAGLTRDRGLVLLPDGRALAFDHRSPLDLASLCKVRRRPPVDWKPPAEPPRFADRVELVTRIPPQMAPDLDDEQAGPSADPDGGDPLEELGDEIGTESPRPKDAGPARSLLGKATLRAGQGMHSLGKWLKLKGLADLGASMMGKAMSIAPRLTEAVLGQQEGAIRELLRMFQDGRIEEALRHALPIGSNTGRGSTVASDARLPDHDTNYSLKSLFGNGGPKGPAGIWFGGMDLQEALQREYHRAAAEALVRGDFRRAAYIYARLLNDYRTAADILDRGGLHHDAAWIYLNKLNDPLRAAQAFEAAGEVGRALAIYLQREEHALAGDLLARNGDPDGALPHYRRAAEVWATKPGGPGPLSAGDLLRDRANRPDLAVPFYAIGWARRPDPAASTCALRLAHHFADVADVPALQTLIGEADLEFQVVGRDEEAGTFYHTIARLADRPALADARDDLRDRALLGLATKIRQGAAIRPHPGNLVQSLLGLSDAWAPEVLHDAHAAVQDAIVQERNRRNARAPRPLRPDGGGFRRVPISQGERVTAVASSLMGDLYVGFDEGHLAHVVSGHPIRWLSGGPGSLRFQGADETTSSAYGTVTGPVQSIGVDPSGQFLAAIWAFGAVGTYSRRPIDFQSFADLSPGPDMYACGPLPPVISAERSWLTPALPDLRGNAMWFGCWHRTGFQLIEKPGGISPCRSRNIPLDFCRQAPASGLLLNRPTASEQNTPLILVHDGPDWCLVDLEGKSPRRRYLGWEPAVPELTTPPTLMPMLSSLQVEPGVVELVGLTVESGLRWSSLTIGDRDFILSGKAGDDESRYSCAWLARPGVVIGVTDRQVEWIHCDARRLSRIASLPLPPDTRVVGGGNNPRGNEILLVTSDGELLIGPMVA